MLEDTATHAPGPVVDDRVLVCDLVDEVDAACECCEVGHEEDVGLLLDGLVLERVRLHRGQPVAQAGDVAQEGVVGGHLAVAHVAHIVAQDAEAALEHGDRVPLAHQVHNRARVRRRPRVGDARNVVDRDALGVARLDLVRPLGERLV